MIGIRVTGQRGYPLTLVRELGRGGFGVVYLAEDTEKRLFAVKVIGPVTDAAAKLSFEQ
jgi:serine/threonine protein kinase